ncbi:unnamed protein product [Mytilus coruscus]|uniref:Uncharacterized protein n=1 Tax=Mytilus coruscus TaxID=42192 RepID=A0A6J8C4M7_MYTCO|nr:unnamed protein product [Mytilus coruscus]
MSICICATIFWILTLKTAGATDCLQCIDGTFVTTRVPQTFQSYIKTLKKDINTPECANATSGTKSGSITIGPCEDEPPNNRINKCGTLTGTVNLTHLTANLDIKATVTARGCFAVDTNIKEGCYTEKNMLNDQKIGKKFGKGIALFQIQIGDIHNGKLCINGSSTLCYTPVVLLLLILKLKLTEILIE